MYYLYENKSNPQSPKDIPVVNYVPSVTYGVGPELLVFKAAKKKKNKYNTVSYEEHCFTDES